ncbi:MAG: hypothetical protein A2176_09975 [Spirochaetes bacterium RBG_13_51_14]|nr:MAG: hypothetical protein A2176_09975 [Spirochaetes bacterium RBG_13_51_14]
MADSPWYYPCVILLILLFTGMRIVHINADAPQDLTISAATYTDEGFKTYEPRNYVLFGDWHWTPEDEYGGWGKVSPLTTIPYLWIFRHFSVSYASIRLLSVVYAAITMIFLFLFLARNFDRFTGLIGLILFGVNYFTAMYNRLGLYESHLICYIMIAFFGFAETFRPFRPRHAGETRARHAAGKFAARAPFFLIGLLAVGAGFFIKRNLLVIFPAIVPALALHLGSRSHKSERFMNRLFIGIIGFIFLFYMIFAHLMALRNILVFSLMSYRIFGQPIIAFLPFTAFDPLYMVLAKGLYMEFVFLHPFTFFAGFSFALYTFYQYLEKNRRNTADLFFSSWLLFGFLFMTLMYYSPSRYYLLFIIPLIALTARFITGFVGEDMASFFTEKKRFPHNILFGLFITFAVLYTGIVLLVQAVPVSFRNYLVENIYPAYLKGDFGNVAFIILFALLVWLGCIAATILNRRRLLELLKRANFPVILLTIILALQLFQYGKWFLFHEHNLYTASKELGRELPRNAIIAGSWSAGLVVENGLKALIVQSLIPYNHNLIKKIINRIGVPVTEVTNGKRSTEYRNDLPLYLAVCRNVIFEKAIAEMYKDHFFTKNLVKTVRFGYFRIEIFKMNKYKLVMQNEVQAIFNRFL